MRLPADDTFNVFGTAAVKLRTAYVLLTGRAARMGPTNRHRGHTLVSPI